MEQSDPVFRREMLRLSAGVMATALIAGCLSDGETDNGDQKDAQNGNEEAEDETHEDGEGDERVTDEDEAEDNDEEAAKEDWENIDEIVLGATTSGWEGIEPQIIEGEENPTLVLTEGKEYVITWKNEDGQAHNIEIWDENESVVEDYKTELMQDENETQSLVIEAQDDIAEYVCEIHYDWSKRGDIKIETDE
ncbi:cupredoxin domain-containing protein [Natrialba sp. SSL1]|uniref:cupredoxin domain-containing protein n=1 Tax=Natrialba sp. SSL1 TaxID=1869245 RepID=UPI0008F94556|nr:hypothetical protein [Natrialba sp. SSL1]OIB57362.1 hypothetical protein BBD46_02455 [Natrialba sp. SSL1]